MILGLQLYGPIACNQVDLPELLKGVKNIGIDKIYYYFIKNIVLERKLVMRILLEL